jgi:cytochrome c
MTNFLILLSIMVGLSAHAKENDFIHCSSCHSLSQGEHGLGPSLYGIWGKKAAATNDFRYSKALKKSGIIWNEETLNKYIEDPQALVPGGRMPFSGIEENAVRLKIIDYLKKKTQSPR